MLGRRTFLRGLVAGAVGVLVPAPAIVAADDPPRRLWALDGTMLRPDAGRVLQSFSVIERGMTLDEITGEFAAWAVETMPLRVPATPHRTDAQMRARYFCDATQQALTAAADASVAFNSLAALRAPDARAIGHFAEMVAGLTVPTPAKLMPSPTSGHHRRYRYGLSSRSPRS